MASGTFPQVAAESRRAWVLAFLFGSWAAAIAIAPTLTIRVALAAPGALIAIAVWTLEKPGRWIGCFLATALLLPPLTFALGD
jgi:hypothetical protein